MAVPQSGPGGPSPPETRVLADENPLKGIVLFVEDTPEAGAWIEADDQHVWVLEDME